MSTNCKYIDDYIDFVRSDPFPVCPYQLQLCDFVEDVFKNEDLTWDEKEIEKYLSYQKYFTFDLFEWEIFCFVLHNCIRDQDGLLRFPDLMIYVGRGAGKNGYLSFEDFCLMTVTNKIPKYDIDICANSEDQAMTSFLDIKEILDNDKDRFKKFFRWNLTKIYSSKTKSTLRFRTSNAKTKDGLRTGKVDFDEVHAYENYKMLDVFKTGLGKMDDCRITYISTNGDVRGGVLDDLIDKSVKILNREIPDNGFLPFLCCLMNEEQVHDENNWYMANPSLRYRKSLLQRLRSEYIDYKNDPNKNVSFMTKRMNFYKTAVEQEVATWEDILQTNKPQIFIPRQPAILGIDFTKTSDMLGTFVLTKNDELTFSGKHFSFWCKNSHDKDYVKAPLNEWEQNGHLKQINDVEIPIFELINYIISLRQQFNIIKIAIDSYRYSFLASQLKNIGFSHENKNLKLVRPSDLMLAETKISSIFKQHQLSVGDDPCFRWMVNNTKLMPTANNNFKFEKIEKRSRKTDGFMAFANTITCENELKAPNKKIIKPFIYR